MGFRNCIRNFRAILGKKRMQQDWFVKHAPDKRGNINCCGGTFQNCLNRIKDWSENNPNHDVITLFIDKKENMSVLKIKVTEFGEYFIETYF